MASKTPAPPMETETPLNFINFGKFRISAPIKTPRLPQEKAHMRANSGKNKKDKKALKRAGNKAGIITPFFKSIKDIFLQKIIIKSKIKKTISILAPFLNNKYKK